MAVNYAILLSGGVGTRISSDIPKQYVEAGGRMMITYALVEILSSPHIDGMCIVADPSWYEKIGADIRENLGSLGFSLYSANDEEHEPVGNRQTENAGKPVYFALPGENRQLSIWSGLQKITETKSPSAEDTVFIHDAARPYISQKLIDSCFDALTGHDGVLPMLPMKDTVYESADGHTIERLLDRSHIFAGQAPELFLLDKYVAANRALLPDKILSINGSTEPAILAGMDIAMIPGDERNSKVTTDADMERFREIVAGR